MKAYFNERGWYINGEQGRSVCIVYEDEPPTARHAYERRWYVFMEMLLKIWEAKFNIEAAYTDGRIVEEINGDIKCQTEYAKQCKNCYMKDHFIIPVYKSDPSTINRKLDSYNLPEEIE